MGGYCKLKEEALDYTLWENMLWKRLSTFHKTDYCGLPWTWCWSVQFHSVWGLLGWLRDLACQEGLLGVIRHHFNKASYIPSPHDLSYLWHFSTLLWSCWSRSSSWVFPLYFHSQNHFCGILSSFVICDQCIWYCHSLIFFWGLYL